MPHHIAINGTALTKKQRTGVENFSVNLILSLSKYDKTNRYSLIVPGKPEIDIAGEKVTIKEVRSKFLWHKITLPRALKELKPDIYLEPSYMLPAISGSKSIIVIHDLASKYFPEAYSVTQKILLDLTFKSAEKASGIVFLSNNTKSDFSKFYHANSTNKVIYQSYNDVLFRRPEIVKCPIGGIDKYMLFVGRLEARKNIVNLIRAYTILSGEYKILQKLLLVGKPGIGYKEIENLIQSLSPSIRKNIIITGFLEESKMPHLYASADLFVYPTLYEGFGIPILESMACKTPVACSKTSSLPEVAGSAAVYFDPLGPKDMAQKIIRVISNDKYSNELSESGSKRIKKFSWEICAREFIEFFNTILETK